MTDDDKEMMLCAWAEYRNDYGVPGKDMVAAHKAFTAGYRAACEDDLAAVANEMHNGRPR